VPLFVFPLFSSLNMEMGAPLARLERGDSMEMIIATPSKRAKNKSYFTTFSGMGPILIHPPDLP